MHGHDATLRQKKIHDGENSLLDFTRVRSAADDDELFAEMQQDKGFGVRAVHRRIGVKIGSMDHGEFRLMGCEDNGIEFTDEHGASEQRVPGVLRDDPNRQPVALVGTGIAILDEDVLGLQIGAESVMQRIEFVLFNRTVDLTPPDFAFTRRLPDNEFVLRQATGELPRAHDQRPHVTQNPFMASDRFLIEFWGAEVPVGMPEIHQAE